MNSTNEIQPKDFQLLDQDAQKLLDLVKNPSKAQNASNTKYLSQSSSYFDNVGSKLPNVDKVTVDSRKVIDYALNPNSISGGADKSKVFEHVLGYNKTNAEQLMNQIQRKLSSCDAVLGKLDQYGQRFTVDIPITGPNGNKAIVRTGCLLYTSRCV